MDLQVLSIVPVQHTKMAFGKFLAAAGKYGLGYLKHIPGRVGGAWNMMRGKQQWMSALGKGLSGSSPEAAAAKARMLQGAHQKLFARNELFGGAAKFDPKTGQRIWGGLRGDVSDAFSRLSPRAQKPLTWGKNIAQGAALGMGPLAPVAYIAGHGMSYASGAKEGAGQAANAAADYMDQIANSGIMDRGKLALMLAFNPDMLKQFSGQIRGMVPQ